MKINPRRRYPMFFIGSMLAISSAFLFRLGLPGAVAAAMAVTGFLLFAASILLP